MLNATLASDTVAYWDITDDERPANPLIYRLWDSPVGWVDVEVNGWLEDAIEQSGMPNPHRAQFQSESGEWIDVLPSALARVIRQHGQTFSRLPSADRLDLIVALARHAHPGDDATAEVRDLWGRLSYLDLAGRAGVIQGICEGLK
jgi:hypothetical protein